MLIILTEITILVMQHDETARRMFCGKASTEDDMERHSQIGLQRTDWATHKDDGQSRSCIRMSTVAC